MIRKCFDIIIRVLGNYPFILCRSHGALIGIYISVTKVSLRWSFKNIDFSFTLILYCFYVAFIFTCIVCYNDFALIEFEKPRRGATFVTKKTITPSSVGATLLFIIVKQILLVIINFKFFKKIDIFLLKCFFLMMFVLVQNIFSNRTYL